MQCYFKDYIALCKPRVVLLMILTSIVGICLAPSYSFPIHALILGNLGIALVASAAAVLNHVADRHIDKLMDRTQYRPIVQGKISSKKSIIFAVILCLIGMGVLIKFTNGITAFLTFLSLIGYSVFYTLYLKQATPQNIVIGGLAGAMPPLLGWTSVTGSISAKALLLVLIIYVWTPPHFWALAIYRLEDYAKAKVPMLPYTHSVSYTTLNILFYTILLSCVTSLPYFFHIFDAVYFFGASVLNLIFILYALQLFLSEDKIIALQTFKYSIYYLSILFLLLLIDHYYLFYYRGGAF